MNRQFSFSNIAALVFAAFVLFGFSGGQPLSVNGQSNGKKTLPNKSFEKEILSEEYDVYSAIIKSEAGDGSIVIEEKTSIPLSLTSLGNINESGLEDSNENYPADEDAISNFVQASQYNFKLKNQFSVKNTVLFYTEEQKNNILEKAYTCDDEVEPHKLFEKQFKHSTLYTFSRVGFNKNKTKALLTVFTWCGRLCGDASYFYLEKVNQNWIVKRKNIKAVS